MLSIASLSITPEMLNHRLWGAQDHSLKVNQDFHHPSPGKSYLHHLISGTTGGDTHHILLPCIQPSDKFRQVPSDEC